MIQVLIVLVAIFGAEGVGTVYEGPFVGHPLYCSRPSNPYTYNSALLVRRPWVALPVDGDWTCGDPVLVLVRGGGYLLADALDAGPFGPSADYRIWGQPVIVDIPKALAPYDGRARVTVVNLAHVDDMLERMSTCPRATIDSVLNTYPWPHSESWTTIPRCTILAP